jgi:RND family efflux transporter MFP subunit
MAFERAKTAMETDLDRARYNLEKSKRSRKKSLERHSDLTSDLNLLTLKAPSDGVVYYGSCTDGEWSDMASLIGKLKPENNAPTGQTLMTIVGPAELYVVSTIKEADRPSVEEGQKAIVKPTATDSPKLEAKVSELSKIPVASGKFAMEVELTTDELPEWLVAGMTGKVKVTTYEKKDALLVPKKAVHSDEDDEDQKYVWLVDDDEVERRDVETGKTKGDNMEIIDGLDAGDIISLDDEKESDDED